MKNVLVPISMVSNPQAFGGHRVGDCLRGDLRVRNGRVVGLGKAKETTSPRIVLPRLVEPHVHLDKCHTVHRLAATGGDLTCALQQQRTDKVNWTDDDIRERAVSGLQEARASGCRAVRSHVDWGDNSDPPRAWHVLVEMSRDWSGLQLSALIGIEKWAEPDFARATIGHIAKSGGVPGAFVRGQAEIQTGLSILVPAAEANGLMMDFHVDEGLGSLNGIEAIADAAIAAGFGNPIICGHAVSLMDRDPESVERISEKLLQARISVCALPTTNLYLQGRNGGSPDRRGITRLRELRKAGVPILIGSDNVGDAFCPVGQHDPMAALHLAVLGAHLDPPMGDWLPTITTDAAQALGLDPVHVDGARLEDLLISEARHTSELVSGRAPIAEAAA